MTLTINQVMLYGLHKTTRERIGYLFWRAFTILTTPIDKTTCRILGHEKLWIVDGWPAPNIRTIYCTRCREHKIIKKNTKLEPRFIIYDPKTKAIVKIRSLPEPIIKESIKEAEEK